MSELYKNLSELSASCSTPFMTLKIHEISIFTWLTAGWLWLDLDVPLFCETNYCGLKFSMLPAEWRA